jgi:hypothetical protein
MFFPVVGVITGHFLILLLYPKPISLSRQMAYIYFAVYPLKNFWFYRQKPF